MESRKECREDLDNCCGITYLTTGGEKLTQHGEGVDGGRTWKISVNVVGLRKEYREDLGNCCGITN